MNDSQRLGRVERVLPDKHVVVKVEGKLVTARAHGLTPRPGAEVLITNTGRQWVVVTW